jgi:small-conductance mechanosensitive channel
VENWSFSSRDVRVQVPLKVDPSCDPAFVERLLLEVSRAHPRALGRHEPQVWLTSFDEKAINFEIQVWIEDPENGLGNLQSDILKAAWQRFKEEGVKLPSPEQDIAVKEWPAGTKFF